MSRRERSALADRVSSERTWASRKAKSPAQTETETKKTATPPEDKAATPPLARAQAQKNRLKDPVVPPHWSKAAATTEPSTERMTGPAIQPGAVRHQTKDRRQRQTAPRALPFRQGSATGAPGQPPTHPSPSEPGAQKHWPVRQMAAPVGVEHPPQATGRETTRRRTDRSQPRQPRRMVPTAQQPACSDAASTKAAQTPSQVQQIPAQSVELSDSTLGQQRADGRSIRCWSVRSIFGDFPSEVQMAAPAKQNDPRRAASPTATSPDPSSEPAHRMSGASALPTWHVAQEAARSATEHRGHQPRLRMTVARSSTERSAASAGQFEK